MKPKWDWQAMQAGVTAEAGDARLLKALETLRSTLVELRQVESDLTTLGVCHHPTHPQFELRHFTPCTPKNRTHPDNGLGMLPLSVRGSGCMVRCAVFHQTERARKESKSERARGGGGREGLREGGEDR